MRLCFRFSNVFNLFFYSFYIMYAILNRSETHVCLQALSSDSACLFTIQVGAHDLAFIGLTFIILSCVDFSFTSMHLHKTSLHLTWNQRRKFQRIVTNSNLNIHTLQHNKHQNKALFNIIVREQIFGREAQGVIAVFLRGPCFAVPSIHLPLKLLER